MTTFADTEISLAELQATDAECAMQTYGRLPVAFVRGEGARLWDVEGREYLDFLAGIAVSTLGHAHPRLVEAVAQQAATLIHTSNLYYIVPQVELAQKLHELSGGMRAFFCNSGAEANEAALKLARKASKMLRDPNRFEIITATNSFHGRTYAALAATGQTKYHEGFEPMPGGYVHTPLNDIGALEAIISEHSAAIMLEPIQGESGINSATPEYLEAARHMCDQHGLLLIFDEVQCGVGRTGKFFMHQNTRVRPDILTLAKGLANGVPIGALLATDEISQAFSPGSHGCTFGGNFLSSRAALTTIETILDDDLMGNAERVGAYFRQKLEDWADESGLVKEIRGRGLMVGVELNQPIARDLMLAGLKQGVVFNAIGETVLRFLPPLIITNGDVDEAMDKLRAASETVTQGNK